MQMLKLQIEYRRKNVVVKINDFEEEEENKKLKFERIEDAIKEHPYYFIK